MKAFYFLFSLVFLASFVTLVSAENIQDDSHLLITRENIAQISDDASMDIIVWLKDKSQDEVLTTLDKGSFNLKYNYASVPGFSINARKDAIERLLQNPKVEKIFRDPILQLNLAESRQLINAFDAEFFGATGNGRTVCVVDTGVDYTHANLGGCFGSGCKVKGGYDFINNDSDPLDDNGHGTHVAGIVATTNSINRGIAPDAGIVAVKVCSSGGMCPGSAIIAGLDWCTANQATYGVDVATISIVDQGNYPGSGACPTWMDVSLNAANTAGIFIDAASGNNGYANGISYPACGPNVVSVGAVYDANVGSSTWCTDSQCTTTCTDSATQADKIVCFTSRGSNLDILAPGAIIKSTASTQGNQCGAPLGGIQSCSGTSMAAPMVAGAALQLREEIPSLTPAQIENILKNSGENIFDSASGLTFSRVDSITGLVCK